jgi:zinc transport system substrate-binding protein
LRRKLCFITGGGYMKSTARWLLMVVTLVAGIPAIHSAVRANEKVDVFVSIPPHAYFAERVGGDHVKVGVLVGPGQNPHVFEPTPKQITDLSRSQLLFTAGMPFEDVIAKRVGTVFKGLKLIDIRKDIALRKMTEDEIEAEERQHEKENGEVHGHKYSHAHEDEEFLDPHVWLDPLLAKIQAATICQALVQVDPIHRADYERNLKALEADLEIVHERLAKALAPLKGKDFYVFHPAFGYFGQRYGLRQVPVEVGGKEPSARHLAALIKQAKKDGVKVVFVQPQFSQKTAKAVATAIGGAVVPLDDLAKDYLKNLEQIAEKLQRAIVDQQ